jgi:hypothetical protein
MLFKFLDTASKGFDHGNQVIVRFFPFLSRAPLQVCEIWLANCWRLGG